MADRSAFRRYSRPIVILGAIVAIGATVSHPLYAQVGGGGFTPPPSPGGPMAPANPMSPPNAMAPSQPQTLATNDPRNPIHLTPDQQLKIVAIKQKYSPQAQAIMGNSSLKPDQKKAKLIALSKKATTEIMGLLSPAQVAETKKLAARQAKMVQVLNARQAQVSKMEAQLKKSLTPDQQKKLNALGTKTRSDYEKLQNDQTLTQQQRQVKYTALGKTYMSARDQILTSSQKALMKKIQQIQTAPIKVSPQ